ncbi:AT-hook-containing transcription factor isoform X3 [Larimichthys crocea]|uniref:AT-hook-containing transcription factor isoform X3 n=1 Tax=Larimichthys crocea TaxID=215358 RepID=UPI000F5F5649|nr:AT-hook-containing transcription factor isoform X3 [Larimichthys crocea]
METRKSTTAGVSFWTPAPVRTSRSSSVISEDVWEDEDEEQAEKDDDFVSQMDENGIIGLSDALGDLELAESCGDADAEYGPLIPEEAGLSGCERDTPPGELSYSLSKRLSYSGSAGEDLPSQCDDLIGSFKALAVDEEVRQWKEEQRMGCHPERDKFLTEEEKDGEEAGKRSDRKSKKNEHASTSSLDVNAINIAHLLAMEPAGVSSHHCPISQPAPPVTANTFPHLLHFTAAELATCPGIEAETFPEMSFIESLPESPRSNMSLKSSPRCPELKLRASLQPAAMFSEEVVPNHSSGVSNGPLKESDKSNKHQKMPTPSPRKTRQHSPEATHSTRSLSSVGTDSLKCKHQTTSPDREQRTPRARSKAVEVDESRKGPLSYPKPDFSNVEPRVRIPKDGYKPPKSRNSSKRESLSPEQPLVFKSPADIVKEVLLHTTDRCLGPSDSDISPACAPDSIVPQEFRCRQQATTLLEQLQEDYSTLLTKYAEAENTIDRLRLEAKDRALETQQSGSSECQPSTDRAVNLYSDPPKPGHLVQSGLNQGSGFMMLNFPQAQRAEMNSASPHPNGHSTHQRSSSASPSKRSPDPQVGQQLAKILYNQADKFLKQLHTFEDLLKCKKLKPSEQVEGVSQLAEGLDSLERGYLLARDEHKVLQQRGAEISHFDPERELEGLIFQCGVHMDELKEQVDQMRQEELTFEAPPSPPPHPTPSLPPSERGETLAQAQVQSPPVPLLFYPGEATVLEMSSATEESDDAHSFYLKPLTGKQRRDEQDFTLIDHYQSFQELPKPLNHRQKEGAHCSAAVRTDMQPEDKEKERQSQRTANVEVQKSLPQSKQRPSRSSHPSCRASSQSTTLPVDPPSSRKRLEVGKCHSSSLSSLGEITALERKSSKLQTGSSRVLSQDRIISPETDSGFIGSESSRLTPAAAPSPLHQRASESVSVPQVRKPGKTQTGRVSAASPAFSPSHSRTALEPSRGSRLNPDQLRQTRQSQRRRTLSCSPKRWVSRSEPSRADSGTSEFGLESDSTHTTSEDGQNDQYTESVSSSPGSSPPAGCHHGDSLRALSSNHNDVIPTLQAEVNRLKASLEIWLRKNNPPSSVRATPSVQENYTHHNTSTPVARPGERRRDVSRGRRDRLVADEVEESTLRRTTRTRPLTAHRQKPQPDILTASEPRTAQPQPRVSRCTQTSTAASDNYSSHTNTVRGRTHLRQHPGVSAQMFVTADEPDSKSRRLAPCPQCLSRLQGRPEVGGNRESTQSSSHCRHCPLCGSTEPYRSTEPDSRRVAESSTRTSHQPAESQDGARGSRHFAAAAAAAPPTLLHCMPVCTPPFLLYSSPLLMPSSSNTDTSSGVRGRSKARRRTRRSLSVDKQRSVDSSVDSSLDRAIKAARHMRHTSGHMARSLATGLHYQKLLTQSS